jgi:hypothetical protein
MNDSTPDEDLKALFARQRAADHEHVPGFHAMRARALQAGATAPSDVGFAWRWVIPVAAALLLGIVTFHVARPNQAPAPASREIAVREIERIDAALQKSISARQSLTAWQSPTDFLLNPIHSTKP